MVLMMAWMNYWAFLSRLASNHTVIIFDSRGIGNTASGIEPYSIQLLGNDTAGLMDALKIQEANVLGIFYGFIHNSTICNHTS